MEHDTLAEMELVQIPKEFRPNKHERKSPWAIIIVIIAIILCGAFFLQQKSQTAPISEPIVSQPAPVKTSEKENPPVNVDNLEASVGNIVIPDYTDIL